MFRCTECQSEYKEKPDFCDCGNDTFEEINEEIIEKSVPQEKKRKSFDEMYPFLVRFKESLDPLSVIIFSICILLSILSLLFLGNPKNEVVPKEEKSEVKVVQIKNIDEIWDDTPVALNESLIKQEEKPIEKIENVINNIIQNKKTENKVKKENPVKNKPKQEVKKPATTKTNEVKKPTTTKTNEVKKPSQNIQKPKETPKTDVQLKPVIKEDTKKESETKAQNEEALKEFQLYKNSLRNLLFSKIDFTQIYGDGIGVVSFKIDSNGKLINKNFVQKSNNEQLDDAIFYSLNTTSAFKAPPSIYKGETLKFRVKFVGGRYEVSLN